MPNNNKFLKGMKLDEVAPEHFSKIGLGHAVFAEADGANKKNNIKLTLYDGGVHKHPFWGNIAFNLENMSMFKKTGNPILLDHIRSQPIGVSDEASFANGKFIMIGRFLSAPAMAGEVKSNIDDGLQYESSLSVDSMGAIVIHIDEGESVECNGHTVNGPGTVFEKSVISEGSVTLFGALDNCKTEVFKKSKSEGTKEMKMSDFKKDHAILHDEVFALGVADGVLNGEKNKIAEFTKLLKLCGDDHELVCKAFSEGMSEVDCLTEKNVKLSKENADLLKLQKTEFKKTPKKSVEAAKQQFIDDSNRQIKLAGDDDTDTDTFMDKVEAFAAEKKCSRAKATDECATLYPELHELMRSK